MKLTGIYSILAKLPIWATTAIFGVILSAMFVGRDIFEGLPYDVAYSSTVGSITLMVVVLIATTILQRSGEVKTLSCLEVGGVGFQGILLTTIVVWCGIVCNFTLSSRSGQLMDIYHDVVIAPMFVFLAITLLPVIFKNGTRREKSATVCLALLWFGLVVFDFTHGRMNQHQWLQGHGVSLNK